MKTLARYMPILTWIGDYRSSTFSQDAIAAVIVTIMLIPQSLAYAMLAGLPPQVGLYASIFPLMVYAVFGSSRVLAVGPVAVSSLMSAAAAGSIAKGDATLFYTVSMGLALLGGVLMLVMGFAKMGLVANFISYPVIVGFISSSAILIALSQLGSILGIKAKGDTLPEILLKLFENIDQFNPYALLIGTVALLFLWFVRYQFKPILTRMGIEGKLAELLTKIAPVVAVIAGIAWVSLMGWDEKGVKVVGLVPGGLPHLVLPSFDWALVRQMALPAILIALIGFVESVSVGQTLAAKKRQHIDSNQELIGLGFSNLASGFSGGYVVTGGFARSAVNYDAGAQTPIAGVLTALGIMFASLFLTGFLKNLPQAVLAATIIIAVTSLIEVKPFFEYWNINRADAIGMASSFLGVLFLGVESGILLGIIVSIILFLWHTTKPHIAVVGLIPGTEHFRNINRHEVWQSNTVLIVRIDESLYFPNSRYWHEALMRLVLARPNVKSLVIEFSAVNDIDVSSIEALKALQEDLAQMHVTLYLTEVKGPVMDKLTQSDFMLGLRTHIFLSNYDALKQLDADGLSSIQTDRRLYD